MIDQVNREIIEALKRRDRKSANALKMLKNSLDNAIKAKGGALAENEAVNIVRKEIKMRAEARDLYAGNNRSELAEQEEFERSLFSHYLPKELALPQLEEIIAKVYENIDENPTFAKLMPEIMKEVAGRLDGKTVAEELKKYLKGAAK
jgi:hypothetical protein